MKKITLISALTFVLLTSCTPTPDITPPEVLSVSPENGSLTVDPATKELTATFSELMQESWSWVQVDPATFPKPTDDPTLTNGVTVTLPVTLSPNTTYDFWLNSDSHANFKDQAGNPLQPYHWIFKTGESRN